LIAYASRTGTRRNLAALRARGWRLMVSAKGVLRSEGFPYALDNGAWWAFSNHQPFDEAAFVRALELMGTGADWVVAPDVVAGGMASLDFSLRWIERLRPLPVMLAVQNGMTVEAVRPHVGPGVGIFVGGTTAWKLETVGVWAELGRQTSAWVHVGRVNSITRIRLCAEHGVTSFDGSSASRFAKTTGRLDNARRSLDLFAPTGTPSERAD
jgi:hypothetical protein